MKALEEQLQVNIKSYIVSVVKPVGPTARVMIPYSKVEPWW